MSQQGTRPHSGFNDTFTKHVERRKLCYPRGAVTGTIIGYTARQNPSDPGEAIEWVEARGDATLYSFVVFHRPYRDDILTPYNVALVELGEGPLVISTVIVDDLNSLEIGMPLQAEFEPNGRLIFVPADVTLQMRART